MSVVDGQAVSAAVTNPAFLKPDVNDYTSKKLGSRNSETGAGYYIEDFQKYLNNLGTIAGLNVSGNYTAEADTTGNTYGSTSTAVSNGDTFKQAIKKLSDLFADTIGNGSHAHTGVSGQGTKISLVNAISDILPMANGGTNNALTASLGAIPYSTASQIALLAPGTSGQILQSGGAAAPKWTTATYPTTTTANQLLYSSATNTVGGLTSAATAALVTSSSSVPSFASGTTANRVLRTDGTTVSFAQVALATDVSGTLPIANGGTGQTTASDALNALLPTQTSNGDKFLMTSGTSPSWQYAVSALASIGSTPAAEGASISGKTLTLQPANATYGGVVTTASQTFAGDKTLNGNLSLQAKLFANKTTDSTTTGTGASLAANPATLYVAVTNASLVSINNIPAPASGYQVFFLQNATGVSVGIVNDAGGTAANRIYTGTGTNLTLTNKQGIWLAYDTTDSRWFVIGGSGGGGSGGTTYLSVVTKTSDYTITTSDNVVLASATVGTPTVITLPNVTQVGQQYTIKKTDASGTFVRVYTGTSATIDGEATDRYLTSQYQSLTVVSDGTNWFII